jgi:hypothetical protein
VTVNNKQHVFLYQVDDKGIKKLNVPLLNLIASDIVNTLLPLENIELFLTDYHYQLDIKNKIIENLVSKELDNLQSLTIVTLQEDFYEDL